MMEFRNAQFNKHGTIDCEINDADFGWIPFTASPDDIYTVGREIFEAAKQAAAPYVPPTQSELDEIAKDQVRAERNRLLSASDWTQVADAPVDKAAWAAYRKALRDVPNQPGFPRDVEWPDKP